ncbi:MAG: hypothetical protein K6E13_08950 [Lachnospiraceae bacterium]|nr:hypothetical protein [Lachnospiraceae bacterium]
MQNNWQEKLQEDFSFMKQNPVEEEKNLYRHYGFECSGGWYDILHDCCKKITERYEEAGVSIDFVPAQIKEKFGTLRFYYGYEDTPCGIAAMDFIGSGISIRFDPDGDSGETESLEARNKGRLRGDIAKIVRTAEERSKTTCEWCGDNKTASLRTNLGGWIGTLCDSCASKYIEKRNQRRKELEAKIRK